MLSIRRILLPVDFPNVSLPVIHQAATLARHFHSEIVMLHVLTAASYAGVHSKGPELANREMLAAIIGEARKNQDGSLEGELAGLPIRRILVEGDPGQAIVETAQQEEADLIMMPSYGYVFKEFLLGSVTAKVLHGTECPVWTGAHTEQQIQPSKFAIRQVLCAVDFKPHSNKTVTWAVQMAAEFSARLTLAHITASVEFWGPGGTYVHEDWKKALVGDASRRMAELQREMGVQANVFIGSGDVPKALRQAARETKADLLIHGSRPYGGHLRTHGYSIICAAPIPVLNV